MRDRKLFSGLLSLKRIASIKPTEMAFCGVSKTIVLKDICLFQAFNKSDGRIIRMPIVLNGIVLAGSNLEAVFAAYVTYRAFGEAH
jgi:hypothetical protein